MKHVLWVSLMFALPAFGAISQRQSPVSQWNGSGSSCFAPLLGSPTYVATDLIVVWTYWNTGTATNNVTASVTDSYGNTYYQAVGPTIQSASKTASQIFYAKNIVTPGTGNDTVTVAYNASANASGCVIVEYQGADPSYPLDTVSAGYSYSGSGFLDSGNVAPANSTLLLFAGGVTDSGTLGVGSGFANVVSHAVGMSGSAITEQYTPPTNNQVLQRATACSGTCPGSGTGNWVLQMAVFRDASWTVVGGWSPTRPPDEVNAAQYPGADICVQAQNAALANPYATILMTISGTMPCSVDPSGGWISGFYTGNTPGPGTGPQFNGNIKLVGVVGTNPTLQIDVPWMIGRGPNGRNTWTDIGGVTIQASNNFRKNISGPRCFTASSTMNVTTGVEWTCSNLAASPSNPISIQAMKVGSCALVSLITTQGLSSTEGNGGNGDPQVFRGNQIVEIMNSADARNNGMFRMVPISDTTTCGASLSGNPPAYNQFYIYAPSAQNCSPSGTSCGSSILIVAESPMFYVGLRDFDMPSAVCSPLPCGDAGIDIDGTETDMLMIASGNMLLNLGEVDGFGYGIVALDNHFGQEQTWVNSMKGRAIMRTSMMTFGAALRDFGSQNTTGFSHWEDYCGDPFDTTDCYTDGTHLPFGLYHVGFWLRDGWGRVGAEDVTFNSSAYAPIMLDGMTGFTSGWTLKDIHFQNERALQNVGSGVKKGSISSTGGNLCDIAIGFQSQALLSLSRYRLTRSREFWKTSASLAATMCQQRIYPIGQPPIFQTAVCSFH